MENSNVTGIVFAGGQSSRMGQNKALMQYNGKRLIDNAIEILENFTSNIIISSNEQLEGIKYPFIKDEFDNLGPIGGLYSCLLASQSKCNIVIPCDVPKVSANIYNKLINDCGNYDATVVTLVDGKCEPLIACYNLSILPIIEDSIRAIDYKMMNLLDKVNVKYIRVEDNDQFKNINKPEDLL